MSEVSIYMWFILYSNFKIHLPSKSPKESRDKVILLLEDATNLKLRESIAKWYGEWDKGMIIAPYLLRKLDPEQYKDMALCM